MQSIKLDNGTAAIDWLMIFNPETGSYDSYTWYEELYDENDNPLGYAGWGQDEYVPKPAVTIKPGQGFWIYTEKANTVTFTSIKAL